MDSHGRVLRDLRVSVTDRCNFRCLYCLPETEEAANFYQDRFGQAPQAATRIIRQWQPGAQVLSFEEIERVVSLAAGLGIDKVRLTGGEPLLRQQIEKLVEKIARIPGVRDLALTSNGFLFSRKARRLARRRPAPGQLQPGLARRGQFQKNHRARRPCVGSGEH